MRIPKGRIDRIATAGSPLPGEGYDYVYEQLGPDVLLINGSGGTDVCSAIISGCPMLPVYRGEIAGRCLGVDTAAFDLDGNEVVGELGRARDPGADAVDAGALLGRRRTAAATGRRTSTCTPASGARATGCASRRRARASSPGARDATLNRGGVRMGTSELYAVVEEIDEVADSLVVHLEDDEGGPGELVLFVVADLDDDLRSRLAGALRTQLSPRHVPDTIAAVRRSRAR